jgi:hypothetical protein
VVIGPAHPGEIIEWFEARQWRGDLIRSGQRSGAGLRVRQEGGHERKRTNCRVFDQYG